MLLKSTLTAGLAALLLVSGCAPSSPASPTSPPATPADAAAARPAGEVVVFAASSLMDVFQDMATGFQQTNPGARVTFNFGASSQLATQLAQGARVDVFASADQVQMDNARNADAISGQSRVFARNRLVLITPADNPQHIANLKDLARDGLKLVTAQPSVPIGQYTAQMLDKAAADPTYGADFRSRVEANTVSREDNVRQVVSKVQLGEADAAVVYSTDATPQVRAQLQLIDCHSQRCQPRRRRGLRRLRPRPRRRGHPGQVGLSPADRPHPHHPQRRGAYGPLAPAANRPAVSTVIGCPEHPNGTLRRIVAATSRPSIGRA